MDRVKAMTSTADMKLKRRSKIENTEPRLKSTSSYKNLYPFTANTAYSGQLIADPCRSGVRTTGGTGGGACCVFPFVYKNKQRETCIDFDHDRMWCYVDVLAQKWGNCEQGMESLRVH